MQWRKIGEGLASGFDLRGLFGVDAIVNDRGIWVIEVNPRYTSSIEVLEFGLGFHALTDHILACRDGQLNDRSPVASLRYLGKAIIYASRHVRIDDTFVAAARQANANRSWPVIADIPTAGQTIATNHPVVTVFASSDRLADVEPRLEDAVKACRTRWQL
jgi:predicted ATP-grasp superfamily ATP-dependent carboligase